jgi:acid phosphatase family membrane protein YuiD
LDFLLGFLHNKVLISTIAGWFIAQCTKNVILAVKGEFTIDKLTAGGGMPSAHSATVTSLATAALVTYGSSSFEFAVAFFVAIIVIYDARGVRYETGQQAEALNRLNEDLKSDGREPLYDKPMQESMGHTLPEIIAGCVVGILSGIIVCALMS